MSLTFAVLRPVRRAAFVLAALAALPSFVACGESDGVTGPLDEGGSDSNGSSVRFTQEGTLELKPKQTAQVGIETSPGVTVGVLLLGDAADASLDRSSVQSDESGSASVELTAPSQPATFRLRAQLGGVSAELPVSVSELGFSDLRVVPEYAGNREIDGWTADVVVGSTCEEVLAKLPDHPGGLRATSGATSAPVVESVPVGPKVVAAIHAGELAAGCAELTLDTPGKVAGVSVDVLDRPMALEDAELDVTLEFSPDPTGYQALLTAGATVVADTAFPPQQPLAGPLLDAIEGTLSASELALFQAHRGSTQLDEAVDSQLAGFDASAWCDSLATSGIGAAMADAAASTSTITGRLTGSSEDPMMATFVLTDWSGGNAADLGVPPEVAFMWSTSSGDVIEASGSIGFSAARLAAHWMKVAAADQYGGATVGECLAQQIDCDAIGSLIAGFGSCDAACGAALCKTGLDELWRAGLDAPEASGTTTVSLTAQATVDGTLVPVSFEGTWAGTIEALGKTGSIAGEATGQAPAPN